MTDLNNSNNTINQNNDSEKIYEKKTASKFTLVCIICLIGGCFLGMFLAFLRYQVVTGISFESIITNIAVATPYITLLLNVIFGCIAISLYAKCKKMYKAWDGEDEDAIEVIEDKLDTPITIASLMVIVNYMGFAVACSGLLNDKVIIYSRLIHSLVAFFTFIVGIIWCIALQRLAIKLEKEINPEKHGDVLDFKFQEKWLDSCDEAQKMVIYKSAYDSFKVMKNVYPACWGVAFLFNMYFKTGILAILVISIAWMIETYTYARATKKNMKKINN